MDKTWENQEPELDLEQEESQSKGLKIGWILRLAQRYSLLIAGITVASASGAYFVASNRSATYQSFFQILVEPVSTEGQLSQPTAVTRGGRVVGEPTLDYETQIEILKSPQLLSPVIKNVQNTYPSFGMINLRQNLSVERLGRDLRIIQVAYQGSDPRLVKLVLNELADKYLTYSLQERKSRIGEGVVFIEEQLPELRNRADDLQQELQSLQQEHSFFDPQTEGQEIANQIRTLEQQIINSEQQLEEQRILYNNLRGQLGLQTEEALAASALSEDPVYQSLIQNLKEIERQIAIESARFKETSPNIEALKEQRDNLRPLLNQRARETLGGSLEGYSNNGDVQSFQTGTRIALIRQLITSANSIEQLEARIDISRQRKEALEEEIEKFPPLARQYAEIVRELEIVNSTLNQLLAEQETLKVEAAQNNVPWELVYEPQPPQAQVESPIELLALGVIGGVALGMGVAFLLDRRKGTFATVEDLEDGVSFPVLEKIPKADQDSDISEEEESESSSTETSSEFVEAFNALYAKLVFFYSDPPVKSIVISAASSKDGTTTVALHLARAIATTGKKVLLVDANLRDPQLHQRLGLPNEQGLKQLLSSPNEVKKQRLIQPLFNPENLFVLTSGGASSESAQVLASEQMKRLMEKFEQNFDFVVYDTPQLQGYTDTKFIAPNADGILLVAQLNQTKQNLLSSAIEELESFKIQLLGIIANEGGTGVSEEKILNSSLLWHSLR